MNEAQTILERLNGGLLDLMKAHPDIILLGEDILDPYGGAFKVTRGLSTRFPDRVLTTPISEAAIVGLAGGLALRGFRPVAEIMFGDFITLIADQIVNHAAKFRWMYNDQVRVPLVVRTPMGGRRGYGPTHSQSLEKIFLGVPCLRTVAVNSMIDPVALLQAAIMDDDPVLFIEHKLLYPRRMMEAGRGLLSEMTAERTEGRYPAVILRTEQKPSITIASYGYNFELAVQAAYELMMEREIFADLVLFSQLSPFCLDPLFASITRTGKMLTVEEGTMTLGWGAEIAARTAEEMPGVKIRRIASRDLPIANSRALEDTILPSVKDIVDAGIDLACK